MIPPEFDYLRPHSVDEAVTELGRAGEDAKVLAGGQSLLPLLRLRLAYPTVLVDLGGVGELRGIRRGRRRAGDRRDDHAPRGAARPAGRPSTARCWPRRRPRSPTRRSGTGAPSAARSSHADPAGDLPAVALALDATFVIEGPDGRRTVPASRVLLRLPGDRACSRASCWSRSGCRCSARAGAATYEKFNRVAQAWAIVGVAALVRTRGRHRSPRPGSG